MLYYIFFNITPVIKINVLPCKINEHSKPTQGLLYFLYLSCISSNIYLYKMLILRFNFIPHSSSQQSLYILSVVVIYDKFINFRRIDEEISFSLFYDNKS